MIWVFHTHALAARTTTVNYNPDCHADGFSQLSAIPSMRTTGSMVDGGRGLRCRVCRGRLRPSDVGLVAAQSCCTFGTLTLKWQRLGRALISCLQSTSELSESVAELGSDGPPRRPQTASVGLRCGQKWWSGQRTGSKNTVKH